MRSILEKRTLERNFILTILITVTPQLSSLSASHFLLKIKTYIHFFQESSGQFKRHPKFSKFFFQSSSLYRWTEQHLNNTYQCSGSLSSGQHDDTFPGGVSMTVWIKGRGLNDTGLLLTQRNILWWNSEINGEYCSKFYSFITLFYRSIKVCFK